jgi:hypothetical protein
MKEAMAPQKRKNENQRLMRRPAGEAMNALTRVKNDMGEIIDDYCSFFDQAISMFLPKAIILCKNQRI